MELNEIASGTRFELEFLDDAGRKTGRKYISHLMQPIRSKISYIFIASPVFAGKPVPVPPNTKISLTLFHLRYGYVSFNAIVKGQEERGNISFLKISVLTKLEEVQRRQHYRVDCLLSAEYRMLIGTSGNSGTDPMIKATVKNISGSGACIVTEANIPERSILELFVNLGPEFGTVNAMCVIVRNRSVEVKDVPYHELGLSFSFISNKDQDTLIKYIFEQQRMLLKNALKG